MIWCKVGGSLLLIGGAFALRVIFARYAAAQIRVLDAYILLLTYLRGQVDGYSRPEGECLERVDRRLLAACAGGRLPPAMTPRLGTLIGISRPYLSGEAERILADFADGFGSCYREEQVRRCEEQIAALKEIRARVSSSLPEEMRRLGLLAFCVAAGVILLLW